MSIRALNPLLPRLLAAALAFALGAPAARAESPLKDLPAALPPPPPPVVTRAKVDAALPVLEKLLEDTMRATGVPGASMVVVYRDEVVYAKGFGVREAGRPEKVDADTVFQLASLSKPLASTVVAALVGDGVVRWDDPVTEHDPPFTLSDPWVGSHVTLADLFSHRSGLPDHAGDLLEDLGFGREVILERLRLEPLDPFRTSYAYTNFGLTQAAVAAGRGGRAGGGGGAEQRLYRPLGVTSTSSRFADFQAAPDRAVGHVLVDGRWEARYVRQPDAQSPAGGVSSNARDMGRWLRLQLAEGQFEGRTVVDAAALAQTHLPQIVPHPPAKATQRAGFYGLGWNVSYDGQGRLRLGHSGAFALGAATAVLVIPQEEVGIVVLTNGEPIGVPEAITQSFADLVLEGRIQVDWVTLAARAMKAALHPPPAHDYSKPVASPAPPRPAGDLVGTYESDYYGPLEVVERDGSLAILLGPSRRAFPLRHRDGDVFLFDTVGENAVGPTAATFAGDGGRAARVTVEYLDQTGLGTFTRP